MTDRGSIFIESLVASAIVAMAMIAMLQSVAQSAAHSRSVEAKRMAMLVAQSELATVGSVMPLAPGNSTGADGAYAWRIAIGPDNDRPDLLAVVVSVSDSASGKQLITLRSLRFPGGTSDAG